MAVTPVVNGATISSGGIASMHADLQAVVNAMGQPNLGRFTFNHMQITDLAVGVGEEKSAGSVDVTAASNTTEPTATYVTTTLPFTEVLSTLTTTPGGFGNLGKAHLFFWAWLDIHQWSASSGVAAARHAAVAALTLRVDGGSYAYPNATKATTGVARARAYIDQESSGESVDDVRYYARTPMSIFGYYNGTASGVTLNGIKLFAAACRCGSGDALSGPTYFKVPRAYIGWFAVRSE